MDFKPLYPPPPGALQQQQSKPNLARNPQPANVAAALRQRPLNNLPKRSGAARSINSTTAAPASTRSRIFGHFEQAARAAPTARRGRGSFVARDWRRCCCDPQPQRRVPFLRGGRVPTPSRSRRKPTSPDTRSECLRQTPTSTTKIRTSPTPHALRHPRSRLKRHLQAAGGGASEPTSARRCLRLPPQLLASHHLPPPVNPRNLPPPQQCGLRPLRISAASAAHDRRLLSQQHATMVQELMPLHKSTGFPRTESVSSAIEGQPR